MFASAEGAEQKDEVSALCAWHRRKGTSIHVCHY
jgi:hypothetical protein